jgi:hypothetical protein
MSYLVGLTESRRLKYNFDNALLIEALNRKCRASIQRLTGLKLQIKEILELRLEITLTFKHNGRKFLRKEDLIRSRFCRLGAAKRNPTNPVGWVMLRCTQPMVIIESPFLMLHNSLILDRALA